MNIYMYISFSLSLLRNNYSSIKYPSRVEIAATGMGVRGKGKGGVGSLGVCFCGFFK